MRRYELMLVLRPDLPDDRSQAILDRATRSIAGSGGQLVKVSPWGRRRLAYPIGPYHEGSYHIVVFDSPPEGVLGLERDLAISEEVMRHLVTRVERPTATHRTTGRRMTSSSPRASSSTSRRARRPRPPSTDVRRRRGGGLPCRSTSA